MSTAETFEDMGEEAPPIALFEIGLALTIEEGTNIAAVGISVRIGPHTLFMTPENLDEEHTRAELQALLKEFLGVLGGMLPVLTEYMPPAFALAQQAMREMLVKGALKIDPNTTRN